MDSSHCVCKGSVINYSRGGGGLQNGRGASQVSPLQKKGWGHNKFLDMRNI